VSVLFKDFLFFVLT